MDCCTPHLAASAAGGPPPRPPSSAPESAPVQAGPGLDEDQEGAVAKLSPPWTDEAVQKEEPDALQEEQPDPLQEANERLQQELADAELVTQGLLAEADLYRKKLEESTQVKYVDVESLHSSRNAFGEEDLDSEKDVEEWMKQADEEEGVHDQAITVAEWMRVVNTDLGPTANISTIVGSALAFRVWLQILIYVLSVAVIIFVLVARATKLGGEVVMLSACEGRTSDPHGRRPNGGAPHQLMVGVCYAMATVGLTTYAVSLLGQPLFLGYLVGGVVVGPLWGLDIVHTVSEISDLSSLGLVLLFFMVGLELDVSGLLRMGKVVLLTGLLQFPLSAAVTYGICVLWEQAFGMSLAGSGQYAILYVSMCCSASSTMIVVKLLSELADMDSSPGRLTIGIMIFQDIWTMAVLAVQPDLGNPKPLELLKKFAEIIVLVVVAGAYAKYVMPTVFLSSANNVELMLVISLSWCLFMCCLAVLPFIGLSMELAALTSGVALATFPYSAEFNGKIKYIRDFFIALFFASLGMQIPAPTLEPIAKAVVLAVVVLLSRLVGLWLVVWGLGGGGRLATVSTINLGQVSEFALVICSLGVDFGHVEPDTLTIVIWAFALLALLSSNVMRYNYAIYGKLHRAVSGCRGRRSIRGQPSGDDDASGPHIDRNIVLLGFGKTAAMLVANLEHHDPHLFAKLHVITHHQNVMSALQRRGLTCSYGDISSADVLAKAHQGEVRLVISSIPDPLLPHSSNMELLKVARKVWGQADVVVTATGPHDAHLLYEAGADYVLRANKILAERFHELIVEHSTQVVHHHHLDGDVSLAHVFDSYKHADIQGQVSFSRAVSAASVNSEFEVVGERGCGSDKLRAQAMSRS